MTGNAASRMQCHQGLVFCDLARRQSLQRHGNGLELLTLCEGDVGNGAAILQRRCDADCAKASVASEDLLHRCAKGHLRLAIAAFWLCAAV